MGLLSTSYATHDSALASSQSSAYRETSTSLYRWAANESVFYAASICVREHMGDKSEHTGCQRLSSQLRALGTASHVLKSICVVYEETSTATQ